MATAALSLRTPCPVPGANELNFNHSWPSRLLGVTKRTLPHKSHKLTIFAATKGSAKSSKPEENIPSWAKPDSLEPPPWAQNEGKDKDKDDSSPNIPFYVYLLASAITAIAAIGSIFEYINEKPVFGILNTDSVFYTPILGFFAFTGIPTSAFLWYKSVQTANKEAEEQDRKDGYR